MRSKVLLAIVVCSAAILGWAFVGVGAATVTTDTANFSAAGSYEFHNSTFDVGTDTQSLYVTLDNDSYNATEPVNATVYEVVNGSETQADKVQISAASGTVETYEYSSLDTENVSEYRVVVTGNETNIESGAVDVGTIEKVSGGGGILGGSGSIGGAGIVVLVGAAYLFLRD